MSDKTKIEWTDATWNPVTGCTRVSPGCEHCYIDWAPPFRIEGRHFVDRDGQRSNAIGSSTGVRLHHDRLDQPLRWRRPRKVFVNSLSDMFHDDVPDEYIARVFAVMALAPQHTFQVLTKRHGRMKALLSSPHWLTQVCTVGHLIAIERGVSGSIFDTGPWPLPNVWVGVTVEDQERADLRIPVLLDTPAAVRFLSVEPMLGPVDLTNVDAFLNAMEPDWNAMTGAPHPLVDWVICGGESGPGARPMHPDWARALREQCVGAGVPFLFKQWGEWAPIGLDDVPAKDDFWMAPDTGRKGVVHSQRHRPGVVHMARLGKRAAGRELDGRTWDEYPEVSR